MKKLILLLLFTLATANLWGMEECKICRITEKKTVPAVYRTSSTITYAISLRGDVFYGESTEFLAWNHYCENHRNSEAYQIIQHRQQRKNDNLPAYYYQEINRVEKRIENPSLIPSPFRAICNCYTLLAVGAVLAGAALYKYWISQKKDSDTQSDDKEQTELDTQDNTTNPAY